MYTANERRERATFQQLEASLPGWAGLVTVICPVCWQVVRTYETRVTELSKYAYKYDSIIVRDENGSLRTKSMYMRTEIDKHGCDHVKPEPIVTTNKGLTPLGIDTITDLRTPEQLLEDSFEDIDWDF